MSRGPGAPDALARAEQAYALVQARPLRARALAERALAEAAATGDAKAEVAARHALGWAQEALGDARRGRATLRAGVRLAAREGDRRGMGLLRRRIAFSLASNGDTRAARREIDAAVSLLSGLDRARSQVHRVEIHRRTHAADPEVHRRVCADATRAIGQLRRSGDTLWEARLRFNRGLLRLDRGELAGAGEDLRRAHLLYDGAGAVAAAANCLAVLAAIALLQGDVVGCLRQLESIPAEALPGKFRYNLNQCRILALVQARLLDEARAAAEEHLELCARTGGRDQIPAIKLDLAAIALMAGDAPSARRLSSSAARSLAARGLPVHAALARVAAARAALHERPVRPRTARGVLECASVLDTAGWTRDALRARLVAARLALLAGHGDVARVQLELARPLRRIGTAADRIELCHATALLAVAEGSPAAAEHSLRQGLRLLEDYRAALGATELRAASAGGGAELARDGLVLALASGRPAKVLDWAERLRAGALRLPPVRPAADAKLRRLQSELRRTVESGAVTRQARLEAAIRARSRLAAGAGGAEPALRPVDAARLLGRRTLVEYLESDGRLYAVALSGGRLALHDLGPNASAGELDWLRFAYARLAAGRLAPEQRAAAHASAAAAAATLDALLVRPLLPAAGDAPLVVVPTGALHGIPWGALPSLRDRPLTVAPSLATWGALAARPRSRARRAVFVAGPRLRHAAAEVRELGALLPRSTVLHGRAATAEAALAALEGARLAHLACHGRFRADSPLFSSLELAGGPLDVYELQRLKRPPELVVLSACDLALSQLHPGDELLGLAAALLGLGTRTVVASVVPVPDAGARRLMLAFHRRLQDGERPAAALAAAQAKTRTAGFVCLGDG